MKPSSSRVFSVDSPTPEPGLVESQKVKPTPGGSTGAFLRFNDPNLTNAFRTYQKNDCNIPLGMAIVLICTINFVTRGCFENFWLLNTALILAFTGGLLTVISGSVSMGIRLAAHPYIVSYPIQWPWLRKLRDTLLSLDESPLSWMAINDTLVLAFPTTCNLNMLGRAMLGPCPVGTAAWYTQECNSGGYGGLPVEVYAFGLIAIFLVQIFLKGARVEVIFLSWIVQIIVVNLALSASGSTLYWWINLNFVVAISVSYELERQSRNLFLNQRFALSVVKSNTELEVGMAKMLLDEGKKEMEAKRAMIRHIGHEIRTPLNITAVGMDIMQRTLKKLPKSSTTAYLTETVQNCRQASEAALTIISDLLDFEKLAAGMVTLEKTPTKIVPYVASQIKLFKVSARAKELTIDFAQDIKYGNGSGAGAGADADEGGAVSVMSPLASLGGIAVNIDPLKMSNVFRNLISNAIKFSKPGGKITIKVTHASAVATVKSSGMLRKNDEDNDDGTGGGSFDSSIIIMVKDDGAGISPGNIGRLFQEGVQFNANTLQKGGGSGFGLYIAKGIVDLHGGQIWATSEGEGHGTSFFMKLPVAAVQEPDNTAFLVEDNNINYAEGSRIGTPRSPLGAVPVSNADPMATSTSVPVFTSVAIPPLEISIEASGGSQSVSVHDSTPKSDPTRQEASSHHGTAPPPSPLSILIVDDSSLNRRMLRHLLEAEGHMCVEAEDGLEAVSYLAQFLGDAPTQVLLGASNELSVRRTGSVDFDSISISNMSSRGGKFSSDGGTRMRYVDAVLLDNYMPRMTGTVAAAEMRRLGFQGTIIGVSGDEVSREEFMQAGANDVLIKPINSDTLFKSLLGAGAQTV